MALWTAQSDPTPEVLLAVYGKHVGWDDHIEDLGLDAALLIEARRILYVRGIGGAVEGGLWNRLEQEDRLLPFRHIAVWRPAPRSLLVGRLWASRDGKGRDRYPMLALTECRNLSLPTALAVVLPVLERLEEQAHRHAEADEVRRAVDEARTALRQDAATRRAAPAAEPPGAALLRLAAAEVWGPQRIGLQRLFRKIRLEWTAFAPGAAVADAPGAAALRVPRCAAAPAEAAALWAAVLESQIDPAASRLLLLPTDQPWLDLVIGPPDAAQMFCLRAPLQALSPANDIPYTLEDEDARRVDALLAAARDNDRRRLSILAPEPRGGRLTRLAQRLRGGKSAADAP
jgi:hypothetical protein